MSQTHTATKNSTNVINRFLDNLTETIADNNLPSLSTISTAASTALSVVSSSFRFSKSSLNLNQQQMDLFSNGSASTATAATASVLIDTSRNNPLSIPIRVDKKLFERLNKLADKVHKYCQCERMKLVNSPPYIIDIIPDICQMLNLIQITYENKLHLLNDIEYFNIFSRNLLDKLNKLVDLFKQAGKRIYDETSEERARLTKYTLVLSHMLAEFKSMFPKDVYEGQSFRIAKQDAADFWRVNFKERSIITWDEFERKLNNVHKISNKMESVKLRRTIQLTESSYVSIFEFDIFTRLFQPWNNLLNNWKFLATEHPGYSAFSTYDEIHKRLQKFINKPGSYLYRLSCTKLGQWAIGYVTADHKILQTIPQSLVQALIDGQKQNLYIYPNGSDITIDISAAIEVTSATRIQISKEQYDMYCDIGTSFQLCKICSENNKDRKLEPCGHMICSSCLENWQDHNNTTPSCPFCRCEIKTFEPIIISPFENQSKLSDSKRSINLNSSGLLAAKITEAIEKLNTDEDDDEDDNKNEDKDLDRNENYIIPQEKSPVNHQLKVTPSSGSINKSISPIEVKTTQDPDVPNDTYLLPNNISSSKQSRSNIENLQSTTRENIFSKKSNDVNTNVNKNSLIINDTNSISSISELNLRDISNSTRNNQAPLVPPEFPPPLPPTSTINSNAPSMPPPPLPLLPAIFQTSAKSKPLVKGYEEKNSIQIKIENNFLLEELANKLGHDKIKIACALVVSNNDINLACEFLQKSSRK